MNSGFLQFPARYHQLPALLIGQIETLILGILSNLAAYCTYIHTIRSERHVHTKHTSYDFLVIKSISRNSLETRP